MLLGSKGSEFYPFCLCTAPNGLNGTYLAIPEELHCFNLHNIYFFGTEAQIFKDMYEG